MKTKPGVLNAKNLNRVIKQMRNIKNSEPKYLVVDKEQYRAVKSIIRRLKKNVSKGNSYLTK